MAESHKELIMMMGSKIKPNEADLIQYYFATGLPPVTSRTALAAMFGYNQGFVWSLLNRPNHHYRQFNIPKGKNYRKINAPKVALKIIQKWLATHFQICWETHDAAFGFVPGRSHLAAAHQHLGAQWVGSVDIKDFFPSTSKEKILIALEKLGYQDDFSKSALIKLTCLNGGLAQGSPCSPVLSNIVLHDLDIKLTNFAKDHGYTYTRYADDLVMSGNTEDGSTAIEMMRASLEGSNWEVADHKTTLAELPRRLKVHGLLMQGKEIRLTKGYRNRIRAFKHLLNSVC